MTFTNEQREVLSRWEPNFYTATKAKYSRGIGTSAFEAMLKIWRDATGDRTQYRGSCAHCVLRLITQVGEAYYKDIEALAKVTNDKSVTMSQPKKKTTKKAKNGNNKNQDK